ncbi:Rmf/CrpP family protein [uncultured Thiobacillus sp.]|uniref:Rmf/CrpP family protein n=1 Tax=Thiobacillus sp. TaxID=924 RepID=UPI00345BDC8F
MIQPTAIVNRRSPLEGARRKGAEAAHAGLPVSACPYRDKRTLSGRLSWSRSFRNAWLEGHRDVMQGDLFR